MDPDSPVNGVIQPELYQDEPIRRTAAQLAAAAPPQYREMRRIAYGGAGCPADGVIFLRQGKFMADFEDDFDYDGEFFKYYPTYQDMNDRQLRGYFSWRTRLRRGRLTATSLSFAFVYLYELINQIGVSTPAEGFRTFRDFWLRYREIDPGIDRYCRLWLKDYVVYYELDRSLLDDLPEIRTDREILILQNPQAHSADELFSALDAMSSYKLTESRFFKLHPDGVKTVVGNVYAALADRYHRDGQGGICEKLFGKLHSASYRMFASAVFCDAGKHGDSVYAFNDFHRYRCRGGNWSCERFLRYRGKVQRTAALLKNIDFLMREKYGFKSTLKPEKLPKLYHTLIAAEIDKLLEARRKNMAPKIEIDLSKLHGIRAIALATQNRLIVEELPEPETPVAPPPEPPAPAHDSGLTAIERRFLASLLHEEAYGDYLRANGLMASVLVDAINTKLFDRFGDTPIGYDGDTPELLADYRDELKRIIQA